MTIAAHLMCLRLKCLALGKRRKQLPTSEFQKKKPTILIADPLTHEHAEVSSKETIIYLKIFLSWFSSMQMIEFIELVA